MRLNATTHAERLKRLVFAPLWGRRRSVSALMLLCALFFSVDARAQDQDISGSTSIAGWPEFLSPGMPNARSSMVDVSGYEVLPFLDSLWVDYRFSWEATSGSKSTPSSKMSADGSVSMHFAIEWAGGDDGIYQGRRAGQGRMPAGIVIESIDLLMQVLIDDEPVAELFLPLDTLALGPTPSVIFVDITGVAWDEVFAGIDAAETRRLFDAGFRLASPEIVRAVFALDPRGDELFAEAADEAGDQDPDGNEKEDGVSPDDRIGETEFIPDVSIWIDWTNIRSDWIPARGSVRRTGTTRRGDIGRSKLTGERRGNRRVSRGGRDRPHDGSTETSSGIDIGGILDAAGDAANSDDGEDDNDDDDKDRLYPAALVGVAAVGGLAILGGTVGYYGGSETSIGLMSGYVERDGGLLLQGAINEQVFGKKKGPEKLVANLTSFYNLFKSPIQPALGLGAMATEDGTSTLRWTPNVSAGLAGNFGRLVIIGMYDVTENDFRIGMAVNFRHRK